MVVVVPVADVVVVAVVFVVTVFVVTVVVDVADVSVAVIVVSAQALPPKRGNTSERLTTTLNGLHLQM